MIEKLGDNYERTYYIKFTELISDNCQWNRLNQEEDFERISLPMPWLLPKQTLQTAETTYTEIFSIKLKVP